MKSSYDADNNCRVYECPVCGYVYHEYYNYTQQKTNEEKPFIALPEPLLIKTPRDYNAMQVTRIIHYACPQCGILQIDTSDIR